MRELTVKIPKDRVGALIGKGGRTRRELEEISGAKIEVDSGTGEVVIRFDDEPKDPLMPQKLLQVVKAIGRGFNPEIAKKLFDDEYVLEIIDLRKYVGDRKNQLIRVRGRVIGEKGKARKYIEERTGTNISVYGHTVSIIGKHYGVLPAKEAIEALITGARHSTAYKKMEKALSMMKTIEVMEKMAESRDKGLREI